MEVKLIDVMGDDLRVANAARVSFNRESEWDLSPFQDTLYEDVKILPEKDRKLINYLAKHNHWTPFSHVQITLREKVPIFVARQRFKHMIGFSYNEVSRRYVDDVPEFYTPNVWRSRPEGSIKQGSGDPLVGLDHDVVAYRYDKFLAQVIDLYESMLARGVAPEQARMILPQSMYTEYYVTGSLPAWARAYKLRSDENAQQEIRYLAALWDGTIAAIPGLEHSWKALTT